MSTILTISIGGSLSIVALQLPNAHRRALAIRWWPHERHCHGYPRYRSAVYWSPDYSQRQGTSSRQAERAPDRRYPEGGPGVARHTIGMTHVPSKQRPATVGGAGQLTVEDGDDGPRFRKWRPLLKASIPAADVASLNTGFLHWLARRGWSDRCSPNSVKQQTANSKQRERKWSLPHAR